MHSVLIHSVLNLKAVVATFDQEKALVGAFSVITNLRVDIRLKLQLALALASSHRITNNSAHTAAAAGVGLDK